MMRKIVLLALSVFAPTPALAEGPFGVTMGDKIESYKDCAPAATGDPGVYQCSSVPRPYPGLTSYYVEAWPDIGICRISAIGAEVRTGDDGVALRSATDDIAYDISTIYGQNEKFNFSSATRHPDIDPYWMMHLLTNQQHYAYGWTKRSGSTLKNNVESILVGATASNLYSGAVVVTFWSDKHVPCVANEHAARSKAF